MIRTLLLTALLLAPCPAFAADWPHWLGPNRDGKATEMADGSILIQPPGMPPMIYNIEGKEMKINGINVPMNSAKIIPGTENIFGIPAKK